MRQEYKDFLKRNLPEGILRSIRALRRFARMELTDGPLTYNEGGLASQHNCDFTADELFMRAYELGKGTGSWTGVWGTLESRWRAYVGCWAAAHAKQLDGDFVECGVNKGGMAMTVMHYVNFIALPKKFYLLDTFSGLVERLISPQENRFGIKPGGYEECYDHVQRMFQDYPNVVIIRGPVPETLSRVPAEKAAYLSIGMNCVKPEIAAAEFFWDRLVRGAIMLLDDYGWALHIHQKHAFDQFALSKGVQVLSLPTGQGLILKP